MIKYEIFLQKYLECQLMASSVRAGQSQLDERVDPECLETWG